MTNLSDIEKRYEAGLENLRLKFTSSNGIPVTRTHITLAEYEAVKDLQRQVQEREADARRYRLIRPASFTRPLNVVDDELNPLNDEELDAAIDAVLNKEPTR